MATATAGRVAVPTWQLDPAHSSIEFAVKHMMMTTVRGRSPPSFSRSVACALPASRAATIGQLVSHGRTPFWPQGCSTSPQKRPSASRPSIRSACGFM